MQLASAAFLAIDFQRAFDSPPWPRRWNTALDANGIRLIQSWRRTSRPLIHVRHDSVAPNSTLRPGLPGNAFRSGFEPLPGEAVVPKNVNAAFIGTDLEARLQGLGVDTVVTCGISTDMCVSTTVRVGANLGFRMILVADACDCFDLPGGAGHIIPAETVHAIHVATLAYEFAEVVTTDELLNHLPANAAAA